MKTIASKIFLVATVCALVGLGALAIHSTTNGEHEWVRNAQHVFSVSFAEGGWSILPLAACLTSGVALVLAVAGQLLARLNPSRPTARESLVPSNLGQAVEQVRRRVASSLTGQRPDIIGAVDELIFGAARVEASDIHLSPAPDGLRLTYRVHGALYDVTTIDGALGTRVATRIKVAARLDPFTRDTPQDGRLLVPLEGGAIEARVSTLPTDYSERVVLRLVRGAGSIPDLSALGFSEPVQRGLVDLLTRPQGLVFVTGPVGSGKTTTLYACLKHLFGARGRTTSMVTLEDPIELRLPFATQSQIQAKQGMTFAKALRSALRQDPNVLMVGEVRDQETAEIAIQAGLTGHLILTTVHGHSAAAPFARLLDMKVAPFALASATVGSLAQRLVRTLCTHCSKPFEPTNIVVEHFRKAGVSLPEADYHESNGCEYCEGTGFTGRVPIAELLTMDSNLQQAIYDRRPTADLHALAVAQGMTALLRDGLARARAGQTALTEVLRVVG